MRLSRITLVLSTAVVLALTGCVPSTATPTPSSTSSGSGSPTPGGSSTPTEEQEVEEDEVVAAIVVVTSSVVSVFGSDGSTLVSVNYGTDAGTVVAQLSEALDEDAVVVPIPGDADSPCPPATAYDFGGLRIETPGSLWSAEGAAYEAIVTSASTAEGVPIETIAGQRIGASRPAFLAAVGEYAVLYDEPERIGIDILNPEAGEYDRIGTYAEFSGDTLTYLAAPNQLGFIGSCG